MDNRTRHKIRFASLVSVVLCVALTIGYAIGGGDFRGPSLIAYFVMLVLCLALAVRLALEDAQ